jgi:hypothetical protein
MNSISAKIDVLAIEKASVELKITNQSKNSQEIQQ